MKPITRRLLGFSGAVSLVFGLLCLNYTKATGIEHHREVATRRGLPQPGEPIRLTGVATTVLGSGLIGYVFGAGRRTTTP